MSELYLIAFLLFFVLNVGYLISHIKLLSPARVTSWLFIFFSILLTLVLFNDSLPILRMLAIITVTLFSMKAIVLVEAYYGKPKLNYFQWMAFSAGWFGMRPQLFEKLPSPSLNDKVRLLIKGFTRIVLGLFILVVSGYVALNYEVHYFASGLLALIGMSFVLHFGILTISAAYWRFFGVDCRELFRSPGLSMSLKEFWGKRWNLAFSEMTALVIYRPLKNKLDKGFAVFCAFLFSGILHEIAISVPVKSGYGLPMLYFCIHGLLMLMEDKLTFVKKITSNKLSSRIWVLTWLILPMPLLFHKEFMFKIVFPMTNQLTSIFFG